MDADAATEPVTEAVDLSTTCLVCGEPMREEHAHYRCPVCGWRDSCCDGPY
jgi:transposase